MLKGMFAPIQTTSSPLTIINNFAVRYDLFTHQRGAGVFEFQEFTPFFLVQLNKRILLSGELIFAPSGVALGQAQADIFINDWLTMDIGYFLAPIGFWNERFDPEWINKLPDQPLVMRQVIPDGLTLTGLQFRGGKYLFGSPVKMEYSVFATDGLGVPGSGQAADWADLGQVIGTTANINQGMAYGGTTGVLAPHPRDQLWRVGARQRSLLPRRRGDYQHLAALFQLPSWELGFPLRVRPELRANQVVHRQQHRAQWVLYPARLS